jgi:hypothetical protein
LSNPRTGLTLGLFAIGLVAGIAAFGVLRVAPTTGPYPTLPGTAEPTVSATLADAIEADDPRALAGTVDAETLGRLAETLKPIVEVSEVSFVGAVAQEQGLLAGYIAHGLDQGGSKWIVGFVLHVQENRVVGVN